MNVTKSQNKLYSNIFINSETVNYAIVFAVASFFLLLFKQIFKVAFSLSAPIAVLIAFAIWALILFFGEKFFVFNKMQRTNLLKQILLLIVRTAVDFGFYKIFSFVFIDLLNKSYTLAFIFTGLIAFLFNYYFDKILLFDCITKATNLTNGKAYKAFFYNRFVAFSMLLSLIGICFVFLVFKLFPFGDMTVMRMDLYHQYGPLFTEFYDRVVEHKSFLYSWESGGGSSFLGNYFNYLSSPISLIIFLFDRKQIAYAITTLVIVKGVLSSATFTYYIKKSLNSHCYASSAFGALYAFCGYFLAYYWNIMWIDGMILLPLIALGIEKIINKGNAKLYIGSLTLLLFSSYYMGYMCCIFSVVYFLIYFFIKNNGGEKVNNIKYNKLISNIFNNKFINRGFKFAISSLLCGALCAVTLIPIYFILQACSATSDSFPSTFESYFNIIDMLSSHIAGLETTIRSSGDDVLPNIYCGILTIILVPLYVMNKKISIKEKALYILLLLFFVFSFDNNTANFIWHAFHFPNDLPYRFSYMYSFILLVIAYKGLQKINAIRYQDIAITGMVWVLIVLYFQKNPTNKISEVSIYITLAFILVWTGILLLIKKGALTKIVAGVSIVAIVFCEIIIADSQSYLFTQTQDNYVVNYDSYEEAIDYTYSNDKDFYRTELCYLDTRMDPCLYGYQGMSTFSSMAYDDYSQTQYSLGMFGNRINSYTYNTQTPVYNMMYGIKYLMYKNTGVEPSTDYYSEYYQTNDNSTTVYQNSYYLPIAFETSSDIKSWDTSEGNPFEVQEDFIDKATGVSNVFSPVKYISTECDNASCDEVNENGTYFLSKNDENSEYGTVDITIKTVNDSNLYVYVTSPDITSVNYYWNSDNEDNDYNEYTDSQYQDISEPYILDLGMHKKGEEIKISLDLSNIDTTDTDFEIYAYNINKDVFESAYNLLDYGKLNITSYTQTTINGTINANYNGFLYTSIPYDDGWSVYIDGEKAKTFSIGNSQLATTLKQGEHSITLKYSPKGLKYGAVISVAGWLCIIALAIIKKFSKKENDIEIC